MVSSLITAVKKFHQWHQGKSLTLKWTNRGDLGYGRRKHRRAFRYKNEQMENMFVIKKAWDQQPKDYFLGYEMWEWQDKEVYTKGWPVKREKKKFKEVDTTRKRSKFVLRQSRSARYQIQISFWIVNEFSKNMKADKVKRKSKRNTKKCSWLRQADFPGTRVWSITSGF